MEETNNEWLLLVEPVVTFVSARRKFTGALEKNFPPTHPGEGTYLVEIDDDANSFPVGLCTNCLGETPQATSGKSPKSRKDSQVKAKSSKGKAPSGKKKPVRKPEKVTRKKAKPGKAVR